MAAFSSVDLAGSSGVTIRAGAAQSVVVHADDNLLARVTMRVRAGTPVIGTRGSFTTSSPMSVVVSAPSLQAVAVSVSGAIVYTGNPAHVTTSITGSGTITRQ